jgi:hypothetical protein
LLRSFLQRGILQSLHLKVVWMYSVSPVDVKYLRHIKQFWWMDLPTFLPLIPCLFVSSNLVLPSLSVILSKMLLFSNLVKASRSFCRRDLAVNFLHMRSENSTTSMSVYLSFLKLRYKRCMSMTHMPKELSTGGTNNCGWATSSPILNFFGAACCARQWAEGSHTVDVPAPDDLSPYKQHFHNHLQSNSCTVFQQTQLSHK